MNAVLKEEVPDSRLNYSIALVPPSDIKDIWDSVNHFLEPAVDRSNGRWEMNALYESLENFNQHLWLIFDEFKRIHAAAVTQMVTYPGKSMMVIEFIGGKGLKYWVDDFVGLIEQWAKDNGCSGVEATARFGFWKWLESHNYDKAYTVFEKRF